MGEQEMIDVTTPEGAEITVRASKIDYIIATYPGATLVMANGATLAVSESKKTIEARIQKTIEARMQLLNKENK